MGRSCCDGIEYGPLLFSLDSFFIPWILLCIDIRSHDT